MVDISLLFSWFNASYKHGYMTIYWHGYFMYSRVTERIMDVRPNWCHNSSRDKVVILLSCLIIFFIHSCSILYTRPIDCIDAKCLIECQSRLGMARPSPKVIFWFISLVIMCLMDSKCYNKFWALAKILSLKSALNPVDSGICMLEIVPGWKNAYLWERPEFFGC